MGFQIEDGKGRGFGAGVGRNNRLLTNSVTESIFSYSAEEGDAYFLGTPPVGVTGTAETAVFFVENNENDFLIFENFFFTTQDVVGSTNTTYTVSWYKNPTGITNGTATSALNQNFSSSNELNAIVEYGSSTSTMTGGTLVASLTMPIANFVDIPANLVLGKGSSFGLTITAPASTTSLPVQFGGRSIIYRENY